MIKVVGLVIKTVKVNDKDAEVSILTKSKILSFFARGVYGPKSKNIYSINLLATSEFELFESAQGNYSLKTGRVIKYFSNIYKDFSSLTVLSSMAEMTFKFVEPSETNNLVNYFYRIEEAIDNGYSCLTLLNIYIANVLKICGLSPRLDSCVRCGSIDDLHYFSFNDGGFLCENCATNSKDAIQNVSYKFWKHIFTVSPNKIAEMEISREDNLKILNALLIYSEDKLGGLIINRDLLNLL